MRVLFLCSTYMQLINIIQLKRTVLKTAHADIIINDHSRNSKEVAKRLEEINLFDRVKCVNNKEIMFKQTFLSDISDVISINFGKNKKFRKMLWDNIGYYEKFIFIIWIYYCYVYGILWWRMVANHSLCVLKKELRVILCWM